MSRILLLWSCFAAWLLCAAPASVRAGRLDLDEALRLIDQASLRVELGRHAARVTGVAVGKGGLIATSSLDRTLRLWALDSDENEAVLRPPSEPTGLEGQLGAVALSPDGRILATSGRTQFFETATGRGSAIYLFDRRTGELLRRLPGDTRARSFEQYSRLLYSPDGKRLVGIRNLALPVRAFLVATGEPLPGELPEHRYIIDGDFDPAGRLLLTDAGGDLLLFDSKLRSLPAPPRLATPAQKLRFSPDGQVVALLLGNGQLEVRRGKDLAPLPGAPPLPMIPGAHHLIFLPGGRELCVAGDARPGAANVATCVSLQKKAPPREVPLGVRDEISALAALPDGGLAFGTASGTVGTRTAAGELRLRGVPSPLDEAPAGLEIDDTADVVQWPLGSQRTARFRVSTQELGVGRFPALRAPRTQLPAPFELQGWRFGIPVQLDGAVLVIPGERSRCLAVASDGQSFVLGSDVLLRRYDLRVATGGTCGLGPPPARPADPWNRPAPKPCFETRLASEALAVNVSSDGRTVVAALRDGSLRWYGLSDGKEQRALVVSSDGRRYILVAPDGKFAAGPGGDELVGWHFNRPADQAAAFIPLGHFRRSLARSELPVGTSSPVPVLQPEGVPPGPNLMDPAVAPLRTLLPPLTTILSPEDRSEVGERQLAVTISARSPNGQPITAVRILVDGRVQAETRGVVTLEESASPAPAATAVERRLLVTLPARDVTVAAYAESAAGAGPPAVIRLRWIGPPPEPSDASEPRLRVLSVGVSRYQRPDLKLAFAEKDARDLAALLERQAGPKRLYRQAEVRVLTNEEATLSRVLAALDGLSAGARASDTAVIFLAGHGIHDAASGQYAFLPHDTETSGTPRTLLSAVTLQQAIAKLPGRVVLLLDTCHAGDVLPGRRGRALDGVLSELASVEGGVVVMAATTGAQLSQESSSWGNGAFTRAVLEGLGGAADFRRTGRVTLNMLDLYVSERVRELTDGAQTPATAKPATIADFPLLMLAP